MHRNVVFSERFLHLVSTCQAATVCRQMASAGADGAALEQAIVTAASWSGGECSPPHGKLPETHGTDASLQPARGTCSTGAPARVSAGAAEKAAMGLLPAASPLTNGSRAAAVPLPAGNGHLPPQSHWGGGHGNQGPLQGSEQSAGSSVPGSSSASPQRPAWRAAEPPAVVSWPGQPVTSSFSLASKPGSLDLDHRGTAGQLPPLAPVKASGATALSSSPVQNGRSVLGKRQDSEAESELDHELMVSLIPDLGIGLSSSQPGEEDNQESLVLHRFPARKGHPICDFYQKTGHCKVRQ